MIKNTNYSTTSTECRLPDIDFTEARNGINLVYDQLDAALADMCYSNFMITHSVFQKKQITFLDIFLNESHTIEGLCYLRF